MNAVERPRCHRPPQVSRRGFLRQLLPAALAASTVGSGTADARFAPFDRVMEEFMQRRKVPGGALAVVKDRRLVYVRGYGSAGSEDVGAVKAESLFRIASLTKPITAVAVLHLVEAGKLSLATRVFDLVSPPPWVASGKTPDARLRSITVQQLLAHTGGWDRDRSPDPMFQSREIAAALGVPSPPRPLDIIRYMLGQRLDFDPGTRFAYSNFGYCVLGRVIEQVTGRSYDGFVREAVLGPAGITRMRLGASLRSARAPGEVCYCTRQPSQRPSVFADQPGLVAEPYGSFCLESMDAHGGWLASAVDLARFASALENRARGALLGAATFQSMYAPPPAPVARQPDGRVQDHYYGCGWLVRPVGKAGEANYWHNGSLPGTYSLLVRRWDGLSWVVLFNQRSEDPRLPDGAIDPALHRAAAAVQRWPDHDLFDRS